MSEHNRITDLMSWQKDFRAAPVIYYTTVRFDGQEEDTGNFYDSKEAAEVEVEWGKKHGKRVSVRCANIHSLELSQRRWK